MWFNNFNTDESLNVMIYDDGRMHVSSPPPTTNTHKGLFMLFKKGVKKGAFNSMKPGRYQFKFTKTRGLKVDAELVSVDE